MTNLGSAESIVRVDKVKEGCEPLLELVIWPQKIQQGWEAAGREKPREKKLKPVWEEPQTPLTHLCVDLQNTHVAAALSSRFNHVGVIAIEKHPTERERDERTVC